MDINNEQFVAYLRSALHYLYDPDQLRRSPLTTVFDVANRVDASFALQKILIDAIESIRPKEDEPPQSRGWLLHDVLLFRYVRGYERQAVADQLGISERQLSRDQRAALEMLAQYLWQAYGLENTVLPTAAELASSGPAQHTAGRAAPAHAGAYASGWVDNLPADNPAPWKTTLASVVELLRPLAGQHAADLSCAPLDELPDLLAPQNALRYALLNILGLMIPLAGGSRLTLSAAVHERRVAIHAVIPLPDEKAQKAADELLAQSSTALARQLLEHAGGGLQHIHCPSQLKIAMSITALAQTPVLVIDDNPDTILLFQRYAQGTRFSVVGAGGPAEFFELLEKIHPRVILMDVMMPGLDGWDLLSQIRAERQAAGAAIIICSILPQADLARSLGADGFLQKPVLPQDFLKALEDQGNRRLPDESKLGPTE